LRLPAALLLFAHWFYLGDGAAQIEYGLSHNRDETIGRIAGRNLGLPIIRTIVAVIHNLL
jgi:hypothetical protein